MTQLAFRNSTRMIARLYDALHDPARKDVLTTETDTGSEGFTHRYFRTPRSAEDLVGDRDAIAEWARMTYGWMGRTPDYKGGFLATLDANAEFYVPYQANTRRWYKEAQEKVLYFNHAIIGPFHTASSRAPTPEARLVSRHDSVESICAPLNPVVERSTRTRESNTAGGPIARILPVINWS